MRLRGRLFAAVAAASVVAIAVGVLTLSARGEETSEDLLARAETLCLDRRYDDAIPVLKSLLMKFPMNAGAHYYLGRCYMSSEDFRPLIAKGEFETALRLFEAGDKASSPIGRFSAQYFEMICHIDSAKVTLLEIDALMSNGAKFYHLEPSLDECEIYTARAEEVFPGAPEVVQLRQIVEAVRKGTRPQIGVGTN